MLFLKICMGLAQTPKIHQAGEGLFIFQMFCLGDWKNVVHWGPRIFWGFRVIIEDYDGKSDPESIVLDGLYVWVQILKLRDLYQQDSVVDQLACRIGQVREVQLRPNLYYLYEAPCSGIKCEAIDSIRALNSGRRGEVHACCERQEKSIFIAKCVDSWGTTTRIAAMECGRRRTRSGGHGWKPITNGRLRAADMWKEYIMRGPW
jgi:hypothetical protein